MPSEVTRVREDPGEWDYKLKLVDPPMCVCLYSHYTTGSNGRLLWLPEENTVPFRWGKWGKYKLIMLQK